MDRNAIIGLTLIFILFIVWQQMMAPTAEEMEAQQRMQDSIAQVQQTADSLAALDLPPPIPEGSERRVCHGTRGEGKGGRTWLR